RPRARRAASAGRGVARDRSAGSRRPRRGAPAPTAADPARGTRRGARRGGPSRVNSHHRVAPAYIPRMSPSRTVRLHDLVLFGATGYTGRLVAERIAHSGERLRWALAGRDRTKLEHVRADLAKQVPECAELPLLVGDAT